MTALLSLDVTGILEMALIALLAAIVIPLRPAKGKGAEALHGMARGALGCLIAVGVWTGVQVAGKLLEPTVAPQWATGPMISIPTPDMPHTVQRIPTQPPGRDI